MTLSFSSCSSALFIDCATLLACRDCFIRFDVTCCGSLVVDGGVGICFVGDCERSCRVRDTCLGGGGGGTICPEAEGMGGGGFRGGKGGSFVSPSSDFVGGVGFLLITKGL